MTVDELNKQLWKQLSLPLVRSVTIAGAYASVLTVVSEYPKGQGVTKSTAAPMLAQEVKRNPGARVCSEHSYQTVIDKNEAQK